MEEKIIEFETAKLAKEKGFNFIDVHSYYHINDGYSLGYAMCISEVNEQTNGCLLAPTQSLLQKWLREKYKIILIIGYQYEYDSTPYSYWIYKEEQSLPINQWVDDLETYEEALEKGLQEALKLI